jgi:NAD(P)H-dependent FMN reductase
MRPTLLNVIASTRPGRAGLPIGRWFNELAIASERFEVQLVDLAELDLPFMNEPLHPRLRQYHHDHTRRWSEIVDAADCLAFVMPEYNHGYIAPLKNAIDYLHQEWAFKPVGFVSYGGMAGGTRAVQQLKPILSDLKMVPLGEGVTVTAAGQRITDGQFKPDESMVRAAQVMLGELQHVETALRALRAATHAPA